MKEFFMKNVIKLFGIIRCIVIITLLAVIGFSMAGCEQYIYNHNCQICHGYGTCGECNGKGEVVDYKDVYTPYVNEIGETYYIHGFEEFMRECNYCSGSGKCSSCKGRGKVAGSGDGKFHF
jgi:hypothetical protein